MIWHILPVDDLKEHEETIKCFCDPCVQYVDGNTIITHNAFDNREIKEQLIESISIN